MTIDNRLIEKHAPATVGEQVHVNHEDCPAGTDTKRRLYIKRQADCILAYCHHCNEHRVLKSAGQRTLNQIKRALAYEQDGSSVLPVLPDDVVWTYASWSDGAKQALWVYGITPSVVGQYELCYSPSLGRVLFPYYNRYGTALEFVTQRIIQGESVGNKWVSYGQKPIGIYKSRNNHKLMRDVVIVEDPISAVKIAGYTKWDAMCLHGTVLSDQQFEWVMVDNTVNCIKLWLDGDEAGKAGALTIQRRLAPVLPKYYSYIYTEGRDPKDCGIDEMERLLDGY